MIAFLLFWSLKGQQCQHTSLCWSTSWVHLLFVVASLRLICGLGNTEKSKVWSSVYSSASPPSQMCCQVCRLDISLCVFVLWCQADSSSAAVGQVFGKQKPRWDVLALSSRLTLGAGIGQRLIKLHSNILPTVEYLMILFHFAPPYALSATLLSLCANATFVNVCPPSSDVPKNVQQW